MFLARIYRYPYLLLAALWLLLCLPLPVRAVELATSFAVSNQSPLVQIYGLPGMGRAFLLAQGTGEAQFSLDVANHFVRQSNGRETLLLDGESYRYALRLSYGLSETLEVGLEIPYLSHGGGSFDGFVDGWHRLFGLPRNGRHTVPDGRMEYRYQRGSELLLNRSGASQAFGDLRLFAGRQLWRSAGRKPAALALRGSLKLPTGDSERLTGSGGADLALWLSGAREYPDVWGGLGLMVAAGGLLTDDGDLLREQRRNWVGFGGLGVGWRLWSWLKLQLQLDYHSSFYRDSQLRGIDSPSAQLALGGVVGLTDGGELELAVVEDLLVETAPDVVFHLAFRQRF